MVYYAKFGKVDTYQLMDEELEAQFNQLKLNMKCDLDTACDNVKKFAINAEASSVNERLVVENGTVDPVSAKVSAE